MLWIEVDQWQSAQGLVVIEFHFLVAPLVAATIPTAAIIVVLVIVTTAASLMIAHS